MAHIISIINNKGGTGKTTTVLNLGAALARKKQKVLLIDLDSQCNLSISLGASGGSQGIGDLLLGQVPVEKAITSFGKLDLIPATEKLPEVEYQLNTEPGREYMLREKLEQIDNNYNFILIDCPPSLSTLSINSLVAAQSFIVPMQAENFAFIGLDRIMQISEKVKKRMNPSLELEGILFVKLVPHTKFSRAVISNLSSNEVFREKLFNAYIRQDISLMESAAFKQSIFDYAPRSRGAHDYNDFANELLKRHGKK